jgi:two-component system sensor histidine kinase CpxA
MRGLFLKIFAIFWIAQSLIFVISTALILRHRPPNPEDLLDALSSSLRTVAKEGVAVFDTGGCDALQSYAAAHRDDIALEDTSERILCAAAAQAGKASGRPTDLPPDMVVGKTGRRYFWTLPVLSTTGQHYLLLVGPRPGPEPPAGYRELLHFAFPQLIVAIAVGGATTFVLVLLFTRPLVRLRKAAKELAQGNLKTRVKEPTRHSENHHRDEFQALVHDFNHMAGRLDSLVSAQQLLLRDVSHELRSPLARLTVALELLREDTGPEMDAHLNRIERETEKLNQLIGQLLTLSSMEAIERDRNFRPISLNRLIADIIPDADYEARQRQSSVTFSADRECVISGNRELLYRTIENIVRNAIRYTAAGSEVEIRLTEAVMNDARAAVIEVNDHGPGIPDAETDAIFRPFYRMDDARSSETGGFGVGLAIAERAVRLHHGEISAANRAGGGATIRVFVPLSDPGLN